MNIEQRRLYKIWLALGNVQHVLGNEDDASTGAELLEPIMDDLRKLWED